MLKNKKIIKKIDLVLQWKIQKKLKKLKKMKYN